MVKRRNTTLYRIKQVAKWHFEVLSSAGLQRIPQKTDVMSLEREAEGGEEEKLKGLCVTKVR